MGRRKKQETLRVFLDEDEVGRLTRQTSGMLEFRYSPRWLESTRSMAISWSLPLQEEAYRGDAVHAYFDNLLPDSSHIRRAIAARLALENHGPFELLAALGKDCIGALRLLPENLPAERGGEMAGDPLGESEVTDLLRNLGRNPLGMEPAREFRISIAGVQEKTALLWWKGSWHRPRGTTPTTHIFKPPLGRIAGGIDFPRSVENEWLCLELAAFFGLPATRAAIHRFEDMTCLVVERFDRRWSADGTRLIRVPQEDLCQALGLPSARKYQSEGGPGIRAIMNLLDSSDDRDTDRMTFMRAQLVFFLLGATDGHAKNFSLFLTRRGFRLTPLYDVMTIEPLIASSHLGEKNARLSMFVGDNRHYRLRDIQRRHWEQTAKACGFGDLPPLLEDILQKVSHMNDFARIHPVDEELLSATLAGIARRAQVLATLQEP